MRTEAEGGGCEYVLNGWPYKDLLISRHERQQVAGAKVPSKESENDDAMCIKIELQLVSKILMASREYNIIKGQPWWIEPDSTACATVLARDMATKPQKTTRLTLLSDPRSTNDVDDIAMQVHAPRIAFTYSNKVREADLHAAFKTQ